MESEGSISKGRLWASYVLQGLLAIMFLLGAINNLLQTESAIDGAVYLGYNDGSVLYLGVVLLISTLLYLLPPTNFIGAILLTAWLGGAVATHVIHEDSIGTTLFPIAIGILIWVSIWLRDKQLQKLITKI